MKMPSKRFLFSALFFGLGLFFLTHYDIIFDGPERGNSSWYGTLGLCLLSGFWFAWTTERAETYIERKNARWRKKREEEKR